MATIFDVAKYILNKYGKMSTWKLQKLIFYCQAMSLVWDDAPLFEDDFKAGQKGPYCETLYSAHKGMFFIENDCFLNPYNPNPSRLTDVQKETINVVVDSLIALPPYQLTQMVKEEKPFIDAKQADGNISKEAMEEYYAENW